MSDLLNERYVCGQCGAKGVRLYRKYQSSNVELRCKACTIAREGTDASTRSQTECNIGWSVAAVPVTTDCATYWGYCAVPKDRADWWYSLPVSHNDFGWSSEHDDYDNTVWIAAGPYEDINARWRLEQQLRDNRIVWVAKHTHELADTQRDLFWATIEEAKQAVEKAHANALNDAVKEAT